MIISTRESEAVREKVLHLGISQISGGSRTSCGRLYRTGAARTTPSSSMCPTSVPWTRWCDWLMEMGYIPSFCTACYREGRTGDRFMSLCKSGQISELLPPQRPDDA